MKWENSGSLFLIRQFVRLDLLFKMFASFIRASYPVVKVFYARNNSGLVMPSLGAAAMAEV